MTPRRRLRPGERARELEPAEAHGYDLRRRVGALEASVGALVEELEALRGALALAWRALEKAHERGIPAPVPPAPPPVPPERQALAVAARRLGVGASTLRRWVEQGKVEGLALPSGNRLLWTVTTSSIETLEQRGARGARGASEGAPASERAHP